MRDEDVARLTPQERHELFSEVRTIVLEDRLQVAYQIADEARRLRDAFEHWTYAEGIFDSELADEELILMLTAFRDTINRTTEQGY